MDAKQTNKINAQKKRNKQTGNNDERTSRRTPLGVLSANGKDPNDKQRLSGAAKGLLQAIDPHAAALNSHTNDLMTSLEDSHTAINIQTATRAKNSLKPLFSKLSCAENFFK